MSRFRGIGRYTTSFVKAILQNKGEHEVILVLSALFPDSISHIRSVFHGLIQQQNIRVWDAPGPVLEANTDNKSRREAAEIMREGFLAGLQPDIIHISSLFEGYGDDVVTSIARFDTKTPVSVMLYDLIPLLNPRHYLENKHAYAEHYRRKYKHLEKADCCLAISEHSRKEGCEYLSHLKEKIFNVSTAIGSEFTKKEICSSKKDLIYKRYGINNNFVLYTGGGDERKNIPRLIQAYALLSKSIRQTHHLLIAGKMPDGDTKELFRLAKQAGLGSDEMIVLGYITDEELICLYNLCRLYVMPSWHEGFGLPALEAMACGAAVISSNTTSLPEVIGLDQAMFDPFNVVDISNKIAEVLEDEVIHARIAEHGIKQAKKFSWDITAKKAIQAWETTVKEIKNNYFDQSTSHALLITNVAQKVSESDDLLKLASCIALNEQSADLRQILVDISELSQRDAGTGVQRVVRNYLKWILCNPPKGFRIEPVYASQEEGYRYARKYMLRFLDQDDTEVVDDLISWQRGDIFFGLDMQHHVQICNKAFYNQIKSEGVTVKFMVYDLLPIQFPDYFLQSDASKLHAELMSIVAASDEAICISRASADALDNWIKENKVSTSPNYRSSWVHIGSDFQSSKPSKGIPSDAAIVLQKISTNPTLLCVSTLEPRKGQQQILEAINLLWGEGIDVNLVLVGQQGWKTEELATRIENHSEFGERLFWLKGISDEYLEKVYSSSTCLIAASINEGFGLPLIEAARHGIPVIARDIPVFREVAGENAYYFSGDGPEDLSNSLKSWLELHKTANHPDSKGMNWLTWEQSTEKLKASLVYENYPRRQLLVDISELVQRDAKTGIQRVVRSVLSEWLKNPPDGWRIEPVYASIGQPYRYARHFIADMLGGVSGERFKDEVIDYSPGDVFFGLDLQPQIQVEKAEFYQALRRQGVIVKFMIYDLLCISLPQYFPQGSAEGFSDWLEMISQNDGVVCISKAVADEVKEKMRDNGWDKNQHFSIEWNHLGADIENSVPTLELPTDSDETLEKLRSRITFLMVGTIEPRKGHREVLDAFELLWERNVEVNLVIVGKEGWMVGELTNRIRGHHKKNVNLYWFNGISDAYLEKIYAASTCLIAASHGEGFGLPLIEAAQHGIPILARDIPVFREVAGKNATYFKAEKAEEMSEAIISWLKEYHNSTHAKSNGMKYLTWKESTKTLSEKLI